MSTLLLLVATEVFVLTTSGAAKNYEVGMVQICWFQLSYYNTFKTDLYYIAYIQLVQCAMAERHWLFL